MSLFNTYLEAIKDLKEEAKTEFEIGEEYIGSMIANRDHKTVFKVISKTGKTIKLEEISRYMENRFNGQIHKLDVKDAKTISKKIKIVNDKECVNVGGMVLFADNKFKGKIK